MYYQIPITRDVGRKGGTRYAVRYLDGVPLYGAAMRCGHRRAGRGYGSGTHRGCGSDHAGDQYHRADVLQASGLAERLSRLMAPVLRPLFGSASQDKQAMEAVSANVTANLLGLSNAATTLGLRASERLYVLAGRSGAPDTVLTLIVLNATSIQLIPSTVAAVRAACGAHAPFDIMLPVWGASAASVAAVLLSSKLLRPFFPDGE